MLQLVIHLLSRNVEDDWQYERIVVDVTEPPSFDEMEAIGWKHPYIENGSYLVLRRSPGTVKTKTKTVVFTDPAVHFVPKNGELYHISLQLVKDKHVDPLITPRWNFYTEK